MTTLEKINIKLSGDKENVLVQFESAKVILKNMEIAKKEIEKLKDVILKYRVQQQNANEVLKAIAGQKSIVRTSVNIIESSAKELEVVVKNLGLDDQPIIKAGRSTASNISREEDNLLKGIKF